MYRGLSMFRRYFVKHSNSDVVVSFGVLAYRLRFDTAYNCAVPEFLFIQRKDTLAFVEVCRGRYNVFNLDYMLHLFANMTVEEKTALQTYDFDAIWDRLWKNKRGNNADYVTAKAKFAMLQNGLRVRTPDGQTIIVNLDYVVANCGGSRSETEWTIPRGRRNNVESNVTCAFREFTEETGVASEKIMLSKRFRPFVMDKLGSNGILYKSVYYVGKCLDHNVDISRINDVQAKEVRAVQWLDFQTACSKLDTTKQVSTFERLNKRILMSMIDAV
jgi:ADP-ribose pyrophosphatase YjhB (NUDIX family)